MDLIEHTYTLQWVGPMNYEEYRNYLKQNPELGPDCFNLYYFEARQDARYQWTTYFGMHANNDGIHLRLNTAHEHLGPFIKSGAKDVKIWIGSFASFDDQKKENVDIVETLFIRAYHMRLTNNKRKTKKLPEGSVCIVNTYYNTDNLPISHKADKPSTFDDVLIYLDEADCFMHGSLYKLRETKQQNILLCNTDLLK